MTPPASSAASGVTAPGGFRAAGVTGGLKPSGRPDVALVVNDGPLDVAAAVTTANRVAAAPVHWTRRVVADGRATAVLLNSGCANAATGAPGDADAASSAAQAAALLGTADDDIVLCSTGMIGTRMPMDALLAATAAAAGSLTADGGADAAEAILTTDTVRKEAVARAAGATVGGMAKGAGMLAPQLATMLVVVTTDAVVDAASADAALRAATAQTFDRVDSDGCMSTNDTVVLLASGASGVELAEEELATMVTAVSSDLARGLVADAEGASHDIHVEVTGATSEDAALAVARAITRSNLVKTAIAGDDPNWGRIISSAGTVPAAVAPFDPADLSVSVNGIEVCRNGGVGEDRDLVDMSGREVEIVVDLGAGSARAGVWTNDLTHGYVEENSAYST